MFHLIKTFFENEKLNETYLNIQKVSKKYGLYLTIKKYYSFKKKRFIYKYEKVEVPFYPVLSKHNINKKRITKKEFEYYKTVFLNIEEKRGTTQERWDKRKLDRALKKSEIDNKKGVKRL